MLSQTKERKLGGLCGVVVPHAGYPYSGPIAGEAFSLLAHSNDAPNRILLIGPPHYVPVRGIVAPSSSAFATPLGDVAVDVGAVESLRDAGLVTIDDTPHAPEHALEVELPFLQRVLEDFTIVPLLVDAASPEQVALVIETVLGKRTLLVVSTDLSHYLDYATAERRDLATAGTIERLDYTALGPNETPRRFVERESHYLWGRRYLLTVKVEEVKPSVRLSHRRMTLSVRPGSTIAKREAAMHRWHKSLLHDAVPPLIRKWETKLQVKVAAYFLQRMKTKWGGCNCRARNIRLNTELVKKPKDLLEYVVVHEMIHLIEPTHSERFFALLSRHYPAGGRLVLSSMSYR